MKIQAEMAVFKQTSASQVASSDEQTKKLDNRTDRNTITTDDAVAAKAQEKARNRKPTN